MNKPIILLPFIYVYKGVAVVIKLILSILEYALMGLFITLKTILYFVLKFILSLFKLFSSFVLYFIKGIISVGNLLLKLGILIFKGIFAIIKGLIWFISNFIKNLKNGFLATILFTYSSIVTLLTYVKKGIVVTIKSLVFFSKHFANNLKSGLISVIIALQLFGEWGYDIIISTCDYSFASWRRFLEYRANKKRLNKAEKLRKYALRQHKKALDIVKKEKALEEKARAKAKRNDIFIDKSVELEKKKKKKMGDHINDFLISLGKIKKSIDNIFAPGRRKREAKKRRLEQDTLMMSLREEEKAANKKKKSDVKILYEYVAKDKNGKTVKGYFEAFSKMEVRSFLINEGMEVYSIRTNKWITFFHKDSSSGNVKVKNKDLIFFLTQLSTYIKAGIPLAEALEILSRQFKNKHYQRIFKSLVYDLNLGLNLSEAMEKQGQAFPRLLINMIKASEMTGSLPEVLDDQAQYFTETEETRKQMVTAMMYPAIVFTIAVGVTIFIMVYVVPQFVEIFESMDAASIPWITKVIVNMSDFLKKYVIFIIIGVIVLVVIYKYLYKNVTLFRKQMQIFIMHFPVFKNVVIYNEVTMFTKTFASLMQHNVFITDTMQILQKITNNEVYKELINNTIINLSTGEKISKAFQGHWAFPMPAYEMLVTGERTGELPEMMSKVSSYYQGLHRDAVARIKVFVEPILIVMLTAVTGVIVLSIIIPMFSMYNSIQ